MIEYNSCLSDSNHRTGSVVLPSTCLGIVGGGQLGRMFVHAAQRLGYRVVVLAPEPDAPAVQAADEAIQGDYDDLEAVRELSRRAAAVTVEFENVHAPSLRWLGKRTPVRPNWKAIWTCQHRIREKTFLSSNGFPLSRWVPIRNLHELEEASRSLAPRWILKTAAAGYDGKGQIAIDEPTFALEAWNRLGNVPCVGEAFVDFALEASVVVARGIDGRMCAYAVSENMHSRHILDTSMSPADLGPIVSLEARETACKVAKALGVVGVLTVEFFVKPDGSLLINELAPRPHNSGHLTIEGAVTSQFEQQVRTLTGLPLGEVARTGGAAMANLLGDLWEFGEPAWDAVLASDPSVKLHLYGKSAALPGRKMGHLTSVCTDPREALARVRAARALIETRLPQGDEPIRAKAPWVLKSSLEQMNRSFYEVS